jgi:peptide chain release factor
MIWLLLSAGRGPAECQLAVAGLLSVVARDAAEAGVEAAVLETEPGEHGPLSALVALGGAGAEDMARSWEGSIRWTCPSPIRKGWPRKNWFVGASVLARPSPSASFREQDLRFETLRSSGPGGQHVNKTESAVRLTHLPTGLSVLAREERSQHRNRSLALARLAGAIKDRERKAGADAERGRWERHDALERGNQVRAYRGVQLGPL